MEGADSNSAGGTKWKRTGKVRNSIYNERVLRSSDLDI